MKLKLMDSEHNEKDQEDEEEEDEGVQNFN